MEANIGGRLPWRSQGWQRPCAPFSRRCAFGASREALRVNKKKSSINCQYEFVCKFVSHLLTWVWFKLPSGNKEKRTIEGIKAGLHQNYWQLVKKNAKSGPKVGYFLAVTTLFLSRGAPHCAEIGGITCELIQWLVNVKRRMKKNLSSRAPFHLCV